MQILSHSIGEKIALEVHLDVPNSLRLTQSKRADSPRIYGVDYWHVEGQVFFSFEGRTSFCVYDYEIGGMLPYLEGMSETIAALKFGQLNMDALGVPCGMICQFAQNSLLTTSPGISEEHEQLLLSAEMSFLTSVEKWGDTSCLAYEYSKRFYIEALAIREMPRTESERNCRHCLSTVFPDVWLASLQLIVSDIESMLRRILNGLKGPATI